MKIPQMFYLRKVRIGRKGALITLHVFWNYRNTVKGTVQTDNRNKAKRAIRKLNHEAEFFR